MDNQQRFIWGPDLKTDLAELNHFFLSLPEQERNKGLYTLAQRPPSESTGLTATLWDLCTPRWREPQPTPCMISKDQHAEIISQYKQLVAAAEGGGSGDDPRSADMHHMAIERMIPVTRGSWRMFSAEVEAANKKDRTPS